MSIFTGRELEFLASLRTGWSRLYWNEFARLLKEGDNPCDAPTRSPFHRPAIQMLDRLHSERGGQI
jgi:hypothetical protein